LITVIYVRVCSGGRAFTNEFNETILFVFKETVQSLSDDWVISSGINLTRA